MTQALRFVTPQGWVPALQHDSYGAPDTYRLAAAWLKDCASVDDWGGGTGYFGPWLPSSCAYRVVDGTLQVVEQRLADLARFDEPSDGILLRHVLDVNADWRAILLNALAAFRRRMVVVTFTPDAEESRVVKVKTGWPIIHFNPADLKQLMGRHLVRDEVVQTSHPERIYYLERAA